MIRRLLYSMLLLLLSAGCLCYGQKSGVINPGEIWPDNSGQHIQAHGGGVVKVGDTYYWYGEERRKGVALDKEFRYVSCYSSQDLMHWQFRGDVLKLSNPDTAIVEGSLILERPKVYYNKKTGKFVMYMHIDGTIKTPNGPKSYGYASVGVAVSDKAVGPFKFLKTFRPLGKESRDIGQFIDDDGKTYLIFESRPSGGFYIAALSDDYLSVAKETSFIHAPIEGGAIVHYKGFYYIVGSKLTGWAPNDNKVATSKSISGPWSDFVDIAPPGTKTFHSQSTMLFKVEGTKDTTVIFMADRWKPKAQWDSRYLWIPAEIKNGKLWITAPRPWTLNVKTGQVHYLDTDKEK